MHLGEQWLVIQPLFGKLNWNIWKCLLFCISTSFSIGIGSFQILIIVIEFPNSFLANELLSRRPGWFSGRFVRIDESLIYLLFFLYFDELLHHTHGSKELVILRSPLQLAHTISLCVDWNWENASVRRYSSIVVCVIILYNNGCILAGLIIEKCLRGGHDAGQVSQVVHGGHRLRKIGTSRAHTHM